MGGRAASNGICQFLLFGDEAAAAEVGNRPILAHAPAPSKQAGALIAAIRKTDFTLSYDNL
jgi:hypothetical protein